MKRAILVLLLTAVVIMTGCTINMYSGRNFDHHAAKQISVSSPLQPGNLVFTNLTHMNITVTGQDTNECSVQADLSVNAVSQEIAGAVIEQLDIELVQEAERLAIVLEKPQAYENDYCVSGSMTITVPSETGLEMTTTHGDCRIGNITRGVNIQSTHGNCIFNDIRGDIAAVSTHGNIELTNTESTSINIKTTHGRIELNECDTLQVHCRTTHDPIRLKAVSADGFQLQTSHGSIELTGCRAKEAALNTSHGAIRGDIACIEKITGKTSHAPIHLRCINDTDPQIVAVLNTTHNNIEFCPPVDFAGSVSASTSHGHIRAERPITVQGVIDDNLKGTIDKGDGSITMKTSHGNIILKNPE